MSIKPNPSLGAHATPAGALAAPQDREPGAHSGLHRAAWIVVLATGFAMLFPVTLLRGMSLDGLIYATISRNMAVGIGDVWHPFYTQTVLNPYHDSPTVAFLLESWFFRLFGDRWWVERLYSVLTVLPTAGLLVFIWRQLLAQVPRLQGFAWLSITLWAVMPSWFWIYRHNYLENTMGMFTALAVFASLRAMDDSRRWIAWTAVAALAITAATGTKGPVGLFPLVTPAIAWLTIGRIRFGKGLLVQITLLLFLAAAIGLVLANPDAREFISAYLQKQVVSSLEGARETTDSSLGRFHLAWALCIDLLLSAVIAGALVAWRRSHRPSVASDGLLRPAAFCLLTALSASLPIMISPKQSAFYAAPSWPFYTMALALWCLPAVASLGERWMAAARFVRSARRVQVVAAGSMLLVVFLSPLWVGMTFRDEELIRDVERLGQIVGPHTTLDIGSALEKKWSLQAYLYRQHYISLGRADGKPLYRLELAAHDEPSPGYLLEDVGLERLRLYKRADVAAWRADGPPAK